MSSRQRQQRRNSRSSGYYSQGTGHTGSSGQYTQSTDYNNQNNISESFRREGSGQSSHRRGSYYSEYVDNSASHYSAGSNNGRQYQDVGTSSRGYATDYVDSTIGSSQQDYGHNTTSRASSYVRRDSDNMSQSSVRSSASRSSAAFRSGAHSVSGASIGATTVANGGRGRCPYQIEFKVDNTGKQMTSSKRTISFRFGFADSRALIQGNAGVDCRGEEHDVVIQWSITGGKRSIHIDGREIHFQAGKRGPVSTNPSRRADIFEAKWKMPGNHVCELMCYAYKPSAGSPEKRNRDWRQYNMIIDGRSFFDLPQIFDLGLKGLGTVKVAPELPPMIIEAGLEEVQGFVTPPNGSKNEEAIKNDVQSRIQAQRSLLKSRQKTKAGKSSRQSRKFNIPSDFSMRSAHSGYGDSLPETNEELHYSDTDRNIWSNAPSELDDARQRQYQAQQHSDGLHEKGVAEDMQNIPPPQSEQAVVSVSQRIGTQQSMLVANSQQQQQQQQQQHELTQQQSSLAVTNQGPSHLQQAVNTYRPPQLNNTSAAVIPSFTPNIQSGTVTHNTYQPPQINNAPTALIPSYSRNIQSITVAQNNAITPVPQQTSMLTSQLSQTQTMATQKIVTPNSLVCPQPPSMEEIRNSMTRIDLTTETTE